MPACWRAWPSHEFDRAMHRPVVGLCLVRGNTISWLRYRILSSDSSLLRQKNRMRFWTAFVPRACLAERILGSLTGEFTLALLGSFNSVVTTTSTGSAACRSEQASWKAPASTLSGTDSTSWDTAGRKWVPTPRSPSDAASKTCVGPASSNGGLVAPQPPADQKMNHT